MNVDNDDGSDSDSDDEEMNPLEAAPSPIPEDSFSARTGFVLIPGLQNIRKVICGANHALALDTSGRVWSWGVNEKTQVGRRVPPQHDYKDSYYPGVLDLSRYGMKALAAGPFHSLAVDNKDGVFAWGLNDFGQAGYASNAGTGGAEMPFPMQIRTLSKQGIDIIAAGNFIRLL